MFQEKVIVIAGGATGIGAETARRLVATGAQVVVGDINQDGGRRTVEAIGDGARFVPFDISDENSVKSLIDAAIAAFGHLDGLFSNAATFALRCFRRIRTSWRWT